MRIKGFLLKYPLGFTDVETDAATQEQAKAWVDEEVAKLRDELKNEFSTKEEVDSKLASTESSFDNKLQENDKKNLDTAYLKLFSSEGMQDLINTLNDSEVLKLDDRLTLNNLDDLVENLDRESVSSELEKMDIDPEFIRYLQAHQSELDKKADVVDYTDDNVDNPTVSKDQAPGLYWSNE